MDAVSDPGPDPLAAWLAATQGDARSQETAGDDIGPGAGHRVRSLRPRMLVVAVVPWMVVIAIIAAAVGRTSSRAPANPAVESVPTAPTAILPPTAAPADTPLLDHRLAAAAVLTVRLATPDEQYLDTAVAEQIDAVQGAAIVTVAAAVLDRVDGEWTGPRHVRFAVPLVLGRAEPVALGPPWVLPTSERNPAQPPAVTVDDAALADDAAATLQAAGYRDVASPQLRRHAEVPDILAVQVRARAPGEPAAREHVVWLDAGGARVLGTGAPWAPAKLPAPVPAEAS